ncbi:hypothetical protein OH492_28330 [Vibrio chagasii]|nr:hypothetical protein [Vibrio chagasii]
MRISNQYTCDMVAKELTKGTDITTEYLPPKRGIDRLPIRFGTKGLVKCFNRVKSDRYGNTVIHLAS